MYLRFCLLITTIFAAFFAQAQSNVVCITAVDSTTFYKKAEVTLWGRRENFGKMESRDDGFLNTLILLRDTTHDQSQNERLKRSTLMPIDYTYDIVEDYWSKDQKVIGRLHLLYELGHASSKLETAHITIYSNGKNKQQDIRYNCIKVYTNVCHCD